MKRTPARGARHGTSRPAPEKDRYILVGQPHIASEIGANCGTRIDNRSLGSDRAAESDGDRAGDKGSPHVVRSDFRFILRDGEQYLRDSMPDIVADYILDKEEGDEHADSRIDEIEEIILISPAEPRCQCAVNMLDAEFQHDRRQPAENPDRQGKQQHQVALRHPVQEAPNRSQRRSNPKFGVLLHSLNFPPAAQVKVICSSG